MSTNMPVVLNCPVSTDLALTLGGDQGAWNPRAGSVGSVTSDSSQEFLKEFHLEEMDPSGSDAPTELTVSDAPTGPRDDNKNKAPPGQKGRGRPKVDRTPWQTKVAHKTRSSLTTDAERKYHDQIHGPGSRNYELAAERQIKRAAEMKELTGSMDAAKKPVNDGLPWAPTTTPTTDETAFQDFANTAGLSEWRMGSFEYAGEQSLDHHGLPVTENNHSTTAAFDLHEPRQIESSKQPKPVKPDNRKRSWNDTKVWDDTFQEYGPPPEPPCFGSASTKTRSASNRVPEEHLRIREEMKTQKEEFTESLRRMMATQHASVVMEVFNEVMGESNDLCCNDHHTGCQHGAFMPSGKRCHGKVTFEHTPCPDIPIDQDGERFRRLLHFSSLPKKCRVEGQIQTNVFLDRNEKIRECKTICAYKGNRTAPADFALYDNNNPLHYATTTLSIQAKDGYWLVPDLLPAGPVNNKNAHFVPHQTNPAAFIARGTKETCNVKVLEAPDGSFIVVATRDIAGGDELLYPALE
jgi:hypothetical protein